METTRKVASGWHWSTALHDHAGDVRSAYELSGELRLAFGLGVRETRFEDKVLNP
jgi:hypothetical protein